MGARASKSAHTVRNLNAFSAADMKRAPKRLKGEALLVILAGVVSGAQAQGCRRAGPHPAAHSHPLPCRAGYYIYAPGLKEVSENHKASAALKAYEAEVDEHLAAAQGDAQQRDSAPNRPVSER